MAGAAVGNAAGFTPTVDLNQMPTGRKVSLKGDGKQAFGDIISRIGTMAADGQNPAAGMADPVSELKGAGKTEVAKSSETGDRKQSGTETSARRKAEETKKTGKEATATEGKQKTDTDVRNTDRAQKPGTAGNDQQEGLSDEGKEIISETLSSGIQNVITQIAETLNITEDEITQAMESMGIDGIMLLDPGSVASLFLNLTGQEESALLVDDDLEGQLSLIQETVSEGLEEAAGALGISPEELKEQIAAATRQTSNGSEASEASGEEEGAAETKEYSVTAHINGRQVELSVTVDEAGQPVVQDTSVITDRHGDQGHRKGSGHNGDSEQHQAFHGIADSIAQNMEAAVSEIEQGAEVRSFADQVSQARITEQINDYIRTNIRPGITDMEMQLHPASLGTVTVHLTEKQGTITAQFTTQNEAVRAAVESQLVQLRERFEEQGIRVSEIQVMVSQERFAGRDGQGQGQTEEDLKAQKAGRRRRLKVSASGDDDGDDGDSDVSPEEAEADRIAVDMMQRSGNTVDFTA